MKESNHISILKEKYRLEAHPEGGWFSEVYTSQAISGERALAGSIYFLLDGDDISHFHRIDCDEIWYYHEGCGLKITIIQKGVISHHYLGKDMDSGQEAMVIIPKESVFAAENIDKKSYTFISCATVPKFRYEGFELLSKEQVLAACPRLPKDIEYLILGPDR